MSKSYCFSVESISCVACASSIETALLKDLNNKKASVDVISKQVRVFRDDSDPNLAQIEESFKTILEDIGHSYDGLVNFRKLKEYCFSVESINNVEDAAEIRKLLLEDKHNVRVRVDVQYRRLYVSRDDVDTAATRIAESVKKTIESLNHVYNGVVDLKAIIRAHWWKGALAILGGFSILALSAFGFGIPLLAMYIIGGLATLLTMYVGRDTYLQAFRELQKQKKISMDALFAISTLAALLVSISACCLPILGLPMLFDAALLIFGFRHLGKAIEEKAKQKVIAGLNFSSLIPNKIKVIRGEESQEVLLSEVIVGDTIIVAEGEMIPIDGHCASERAAIFDAIKSGEKDSKEIEIGTKLSAGMVAASSLRVIASKIAQDSNLALLDNQIDEARMVRHAEIEDKAGKALRYFVPSVLLLAVIATILVSCFLSPIMGLQCGIAVLVAACPCILGFIVPIAIKIGMTKAAEQKAYFTNGQALQAASEISAIIFDLNGTLTEGNPKVTSHDFMENEDEYLGKVALIEQLYEEKCKAKNERQHGYTKLLTQYSLLKCTKKIESGDYQINFDADCRSGVSGTINGKKFYLGNSDMLSSIDGLNMGVFSLIKHNRIYLVLENEVKGFFTIHDKLRPEAKKVLNRLTEMNIETWVCSGTNRDTVLEYTRPLGISDDRVKANCSPAEKKAFVKAYQANLKERQKGGVAMVGDEGNDAAAIAISNLGIALKPDLDLGGYEIARDGAQLIVEGGSLFPILTALEVAQQTLTNIKQNLTVSIAYNLTACLIAGGILLVIGISLNPGLAAALMIFQTLLVLGNVYRFRCQSISDPSTVSSSESSSINNYKNSEDEVFVPGNNLSAHLSETILLEESFAPTFSSQAPHKFIPDQATSVVSIFQPT